MAKILTSKTNRFSKFIKSQQHSASNKVQVTAVPRGAAPHRRPLREFPIKKSVPGETLLCLYDRDAPLVNLPNKAKEQPKGFRNQACQTLQGKELDYLSYEGVIRYPSSRCREFEESKSLVREMGLQTEDLISHTLTKGAGDEENKAGGKGNVDFVKLNLMAPLKPKQTNTGKKDPMRPPPTYEKGVVPKYLQEQKKNKENEKEGSIVEGSITAQMLLPDDVRKKLLEKLKKDHKDLVDQLNVLPFSTSSLKMLQRKQKIEKDLDILEKRIANFSREKVFIRDNIL